MTLRSYFFSARDALAFARRCASSVRRITLRDVLGASVLACIAAALHEGLSLAPENTVFLVLFLAMLWWRLDARFLVVAALAGFCIIPLLISMEEDGRSLRLLDAETTAIWVLYALALAVIVKTAELLPRMKKTKRKSAKASRDKP